MMIDPRALRTFLVVCRENSISGAARKLNLSQPAISVTIRQLERAVNASLFERGRAGIILSPAGVALRQRAESLEVLLRDAKEEVDLVQREISGPIRIGGTPGALVSLLPNAIRVLADHGFRYAMNIVERSDAELTALLRAKAIEIAVVTTNMDAPPDDIEEKTIIKDPFSLVVGHANDRLPDRMNLRDATGLRWVMPEAKGAFRRQVDALFVACDAPIPKEIIRCDSLLTTKAIVSESNYVTIQPGGVVAAEIAIGTLRAISIETPFNRNVGIRLLKGAHVQNEMLYRIVEAITSGAAWSRDNVNLPVQS